MLSQLVCNANCSHVLQREFQSWSDYWVIKCFHYSYLKLSDPRMLQGPTRIPRNPLLSRLNLASLCLWGGRGKVSLFLLKLRMFIPLNDWTIIHLTCHPRMNVFIITNLFPWEWNNDFFLSQWTFSCHLPFKLTRKWNALLLVFSSISLDKCIYLYNHQHNQDIASFHHPWFC